MADWEFIVTELLDTDGEEGERIIWESTVKALKGTGDGVAILNYSDFHHDDQKRYQPDILLVSRDWGLAVIEVKTCRIDQIVKIQAGRWEMRNFYSRHISPFKQGENQLWQVLKRCDHKDKLKNCVPGRVLVALPLVTREEWRNRGFEDDHHTCPPIIFGDELSRRNILDKLEYRATILQKGVSPFQPSDQQWQLLKSVILGHPQASAPIQPILAPPIPLTSTKAAIVPKKEMTGAVSVLEKECSAETSTLSDFAFTKQHLTRRSDVLTRLKNWMSDVDIQQVKIGMQIPPGPQRIRGIAGSGKTLLLCQKAARMHIQHPDWDIALVFFNRSLYELIPKLVRQWLEYWSEEPVLPDLENGKLKVIHAWGSKERPGLYSLLRDQAGRNALVRAKQTGSCPELLAGSCKRLLNDASIEPMFDAILIDEGQDLAVGDEWKHNNKQAIYWLAWQALRPNSKRNSSLRRLIWAYDEAQSLDSLEVPSYGEVFGEELGDILSGKKTGPTYKGNIQKNEVMKRCYRTPGSILVAAHAIGMGLLRKGGMLSGFTTKKDWERIGYTVEEGSFTSGSRIVLHRPAEYSPNPIPQFWGNSPLEFEVYEDRESQLKALIEKIKYNMDYDRLQPSRDILVIVLGADQESVELEQKGSTEKSFLSIQLQRQVANSLQSNGISYYMPGANRPDRFPDQGNRNADCFWWDKAITVSRMYRAKGHEAPMVYVLGLELVAQDESNLSLRNQLFVALTRSMAWVHLSGIKDPDTHTDYLLYDEMRKVMASGDRLRFTYRRPPKRSLADNE